MKLLSTFAAAAWFFLGIVLAGFTAAQGFAHNKTVCPAEPLPDENTPTALYYLDSSMEVYKRNRQTAIFAFTLAHTEVEIPRCDEADVFDACCATNKAHFVSVTLQLDPARCATRRALKGLRVRLDGRVLSNRHVARNVKAGTITIKRLPRVFVDTARGQFGFVHSLDIIMPANTECTASAFQGRHDAWPCAAEGCDYLAVTSVDALAHKDKAWSAGRRSSDYPKVNKADCCVSVGRSKPSMGGDIFTSTTSVGVGPPPGAEWCDTEGITSNANWDVQILAIGDWGAPPSDAELVKNQKAVAQGMAAVASDCNFERIINVGDNFYDNSLLSGKATPPGYADFRERIRQTWSDIYHGAYASLQNLVWYGTYGNHDIGIYNWEADVPAICFAPEGQTWTHQQCLHEVDCCASPLWQTTAVVNDPHWVLEPGQYATTVDNPNGPPSDPPLIEFFFLDSNPFIDSYLKWPSELYNPLVPGGLNEWSAVRNQTKADFLNRIQNSNATWKIPVIHTSFASYGSHCGFNDKAKNTTNPDYPENNSLDKKDCKYLVDLRRELLNMEIELTLHGHDHSQQFVRLPAGYDGATGSKPLYALTTGGGCKQSSVVPGPEGMQLWPRNACGGGPPCLGEVNCNMNNICAKYSDTKKRWKAQRELPNVGFASLQVNSTALLVRVFEMVPLPDAPNAPNYQLVEVIQQLIRK